MSAQKYKQFTGSSALEAQEKAAKYITEHKYKNGSVGHARQEEKHVFVCVASFVVN